MLRDLVDRLRGLPPAESHVVRGIPVRVENTRPDIATSRVLAQLDAALGLIEAHQPWRFRHLRRDLSHIVVRRFACRGAYFYAERACLTELTFLANPSFNAAQVASSIVHEGIHARVHAMGVTYDGPDRRDREERLCREAELAFGLAVPPALGRPVVERALGLLESPDVQLAPEIDWSEAARRVAEADRG